MWRRFVICTNEVVVLSVCFLPLWQFQTKSSSFGNLSYQSFAGLSFDHKPVWLRVLGCQMCIFKIVGCPGVVQLVGLIPGYSQQVLLRLRLIINIKQVFLLYQLGNLERLQLINLIPWRVLQKVPPSREAPREPTIHPLSTTVNFAVINVTPVSFVAVFSERCAQLLYI